MSAAHLATLNGEHTPAGPSALLEVSELSVDVRMEDEWIPIINDVGFSVGPGETVGLVGESGSGKTVTSLAVMGLLPGNARVSRGSIRLRGQELLTLSEQQLNDVRCNSIAMIFQEPRRSLNPAFTVGEQVAEAIRRHKGLTRRAARQETFELFDMVEIAGARERIDQYPHQFSGGMCQRVMLAMALACQPDVLVADEPTTALDVTVQRQMLGLIARLQQEQDFGVLLITHDLGVVAEACDRVMVMYAGQVVEQAGVDDTFHAPRHPYTSALLSTMMGAEQSDDELGYIRGVVPAPHDFPLGCRFQPRCDHALLGTCDTPVKLLPAGADRSSRCARVHELRLEGVKGV